MGVSVVDVDNAGVVSGASGVVLDGTVSAGTVVMVAAVVVVVAWGVDVAP